MLNKRGVIEVQFNWIFILIAGALILVFFATVIYKQKEISDMRLSAEILSNMQTMTVGAESTSNLYSNIRSKGSEIRFSCEDCNCFYTLENLISSTDISYNSRAMFVPSLIDGDKIIIFSLDWNMPYKVTNFLYLTSDKIRYVMVGNNDILSTIKESLHGGMYVSQINSPQSYQEYINQNEQKVRFVFYDNNEMTSITVGDGETLDTKSMNYRDITAVNIKPSGNTEIGTVEFYRKKSNAELFELMGSYPYSGIPSLIGAIIADDYNLYKCPMDDVFTRLNYVNEVYLERTRELLSTSGMDVKCTPR